MAHIEQSVLAERVREAGTNVEVGARYTHYKRPDQSYRVLNIGVLESDDEPAVIYQAEYGAELVFIRPLSSWLQTAEKDGAQVPRFSKVS